jgi:hypothetical protein
MKAPLQWRRKDGCESARPSISSCSLQTFKDFPPSQRAATFSIDQAMEKMRQGIGGQ